MPVGLPLKTTYANGDVFSASDINDTNGTVNLVGQTNNAYAGKNAIINGAFDVWQRGTSFASSAGTYNFYTADRYPFNFGLATTATLSRQLTNDTTNLPFIQYCARSQRNSGATTTAFMALNYTLENADTTRFIGQTVTFSFYARRGANYSSASNALSVRFSSGTGTDQSIASGLTGQTDFISQTATLTTTWQRFSYTGTVPTSAKQIGFYLFYNTTGTAGAADFFETTGFQLELGSNVTSFSRAAGTIQGELAACQRYYYRIGGEQTFQAMALGWGNGSAGAYIHITTPVSMRVAPTALDYSTLVIGDLINNNQAVTVLLLTGNYGGSKVQTLSATVSSGLTVNRPYGLYANNSLSGYVGLSAEL